ncbi:MAG: radical SAM protein [Candidatus Omnitrophica bacterium]|nr:radical SAM protein [Candidatus Omnitrophota bacterium]
MILPLQTAVVYGPIHSRRLGNSLGINILPEETKFCLSSCIYCQYGFTNPKNLKWSKLLPARELIKCIEAGFHWHALSKRNVDSITVSGNGEPTLHPELIQIATEIKKLRDYYFPSTSIGILSDSSRVHLPQVREALELFDERYMKLDAGSPEMLQKINRPIVPRNWEAMIRGLALLPKVTIQSLFISEPVDNSSTPPLQDWLKTVSQIRPSGLHLYTVYRGTADPRVKPVSKNRLNEIAHFACQVTDLSTVTCLSDTSVQLM